jgi:hypothetical protein
MRQRLWLLFLFLGALPALAVAQPRPGAFSTLTVTSTSADALHVGCAVGVTPCTGGAKVGPLVVTGTATISSTLDVSGVSTFSATAPEISLTNGTANWIQWGSAGTGAPTFTTRSAGTKLVLFPNVGASAVDFGFGIESGALWASVPTTANTFKQYAGTTVWSTLDSTGLTLTNGLSVGTTVTTPSAITPSALASGNTNDYAPAGFSTAYLLRLTANAANSILTGLAGGAAGRQVAVCNLATAGLLAFSEEDTNSTAANRFAGTATQSHRSLGGDGTCVLLIYDTTSSRWRFVSTGA